VFTKKEVEEVNNRLAVGKANDFEGLQAEHLRWGQEYVSHKLIEILNQMLSEMFPMHYLTSLIIPIFKGGEIKQPIQLQTIMIS
jgi:hypothetical protein